MNQLYIFCIHLQIYKYRLNKTTIIQPKPYNNNITTDLSLPLISYISFNKISARYKQM